MPGAFVSVHLEVSSPTQLSICEAFVYTDQVSFYHSKIFQMFSSSVALPHKWGVMIIQEQPSAYYIPPSLPIESSVTKFVQRGSCHLSNSVQPPISDTIWLIFDFFFSFQALPIERCPQFRDQPPGSTATYNGKCYIFYNRQPTNFRNALQFCRSRGGTLVDESNPALQGFISWELWRRHR